jgi:glyoxylase-like metal-dependent hydrolase (beta-lactamase superfamily II)
VRSTARRRLIWAAVAAVTLGALSVWRLPELWAWRWYVTSGRPAMTQGPLTLTGSLKWMGDYYAVADLGHGAYAIGEPRYGQCNFSYLIVGSQRALLFDTGPGVRDIRTVVRQLTTLPVLALPSHLHFDHVGDLGLFPDVALPDLPALHAQDHDGRFSLGVEQFLGFVEGFARPIFPVTRWIPSGSSIDLGGRSVLLMSVPGHTPDSAVLFDREADRMFAGDFIYPSEIYAFLPGANLHDYAASARRLMGLLDENSVVYGAHGCDRLPKVDVPTLRRSDVSDLEKSLALAASDPWGRGTGIYPRVFPVNDRMTLLAKYPWMRP